MSCADGVSSAPGAWNPYGCGRWRKQPGLVQGALVSDMTAWTSGVDLAYQTLSAAVTDPAKLPLLQAAMAPYGGLSGIDSCINGDGSGRTLTTYEVQCRTLTAGDPSDARGQDATVTLYNAVIYGQSSVVRPALGNITYDSRARAAQILTASDSGQYIPFDSNTGADPATDVDGGLPSPAPTGVGANAFTATGTGFPLGFVLPNPVDCPGRTFKFVCAGALAGYVPPVRAGNWSFAIKILPPSVTGIYVSRRLNGYVNGWYNANPTALSGNPTVGAICAPIVDSYSVPKGGISAVDPNSQYNFAQQPVLPADGTSILTINNTTIADYWLVLRMVQVANGTTADGATFAPGSTLEISYVTPEYIQVKCDGVFFGGANAGTQRAGSPLQVIKGV